MPSLEDAEIFTHVHWWPSDDDQEERYALPMKKKGHRWGVKFIAERGSSSSSSSSNSSSSSSKQKDGDAAAAVSTPPVVQWQVGD